VAEREWPEWAVARARVGEVLFPVDGTGQEHARAELAVPHAEGRPGKTPQVLEAANAKSQVPMWREGLAWSALSAYYQRILQVAANRARLGQAPGICQEMTAEFGMEMVGARVEALRSKAKRLVARGWPMPAPGRFTLARGAAQPGGGA
jgi:hypothetical protein